jgi:geranylgeranyl pyrophosphate synthase
LADPVPAPRATSLQITRALSPDVLPPSPNTIRTGGTTDRLAIDRVLEDVAVRHGAALGSDVGRAVGYALTGGGKRIRGLLVLLTYRACGGTDDATALAAAVEIVHAYSLVHDDLPCMDDDDMRRGRPTVHRAFDVPVATVAGVAMVPLAVITAIDAANSLGIPVSARGEIVGRLMRASGAGGMIGGQLLDLLGEGKRVPVAELERIHGAKTGALISASAVIGGLAADAPAERIGALDHFGTALGLAFQITDDILDVTATTEAMGKPARRDEDLAKSTYVVQLGVDGARARAAELATEAREALRQVGLLTPDLDRLANLVLERSA